jgi:Flp pilus assembly protein TadG
MGLVADQRGAVLAEFVIVAVPLLITFFSFVEVAHVAAANLMVRHATIIGARAASVITNGNGNTPDQKRGTNEREIADGVITALGAGYARTMERVDVKVEDESTCDDYFGMVRVTVTAEYRCSTPLGNVVVCGADRRRTIKHVAQLPHQGARYKSEGGGGGCKSGSK